MSFCEVRKYGCLEVRKNGSRWLESGSVVRSSIGRYSPFIPGFWFAILRFVKGGKGDFSS